MIHQGDALEVLQALPAASVDAVVTDPPYGERNASWDGPRSFAWWCAWLLAAKRVMRPGAPLVTFCSRRYIDIAMGAVREIFGDEGARPIQSGAWVHRQGYSPREGLLRPEHEPFIVSGHLRVESDEVRRLRTYKTPHNVARKQTRRQSSNIGMGPHTYTPNEIGPVGGTIIEAARNIPSERLDHPTQKPEAVMDHLVKLASAPGMVVLDPFCGSGTTAVVCLRSGRSFVGIDLEPAYVEMANRRIAGVAPLFNQVSE